jgi:hypothetical protein
MGKFFQAANKDIFNCFSERGREKIVGGNSGFLDRRKENKREE